MNPLDKFLAWLKSKNITTHTVGAAIIAFASVYDTVPEVRNYIGQLFVGYPVVVTKFGELMLNISAAAALWRNYAHSTSAAGAMARANAIKDAPDTPTSAQVDAATTK